MRQAKLFLVSPLLLFTSSLCGFPCLFFEVPCGKNYLILMGIFLRKNFLFFA
jgi:hypothetical protein